MAEIYDYDKWKLMSQSKEADKAERTVTSCSGCGNDLRACDEFIEFLDLHYCDEECLLSDLDFRYVTGDEIDD